MKRTLGSGLLAAFSALAAPAHAAPVAVAKASGGQSVLAVGFDDEGRLRAHVCSAEPCTLDGATGIEVPAAVSKRVKTGKLSVVAVGLGRHAVLAEVGPSGPDPGWAAVIAAPLSGTAPLVIFNGLVGPTAGTEGERSGKVIALREGVLYVATETENRSLCGRPALLAPEALDPSTLKLVSAKMQRLTLEEREQAKELTPIPVAPAARAHAPRILKAEWATSAAPDHAVSNLTDGNDQSSWAENRGGVGRGEFAVLALPRDLPIDALEITLPEDTSPHAALPEELFFATTHEVFLSELPKPTAQSRTFTLTLPQKVQSSCLAVVLSTARSTDKEARVSIGEISARPVLSGSPDELASKLAGGDEAARAAAELLRALGNDGARAAAAHLASLDAPGRQLALDVLDDAPCDVGLPAYVATIATAHPKEGEGEARRTSATEPEGPRDLEHATRALARCPKDAVRALSEAMAHARGTALRNLARTLLDLSPGTAVTAIAPLLSSVKPSDRRALATTLALALSSDDGRSAVTRLFDDPATPPATTVELLRAAGDRLDAVAEPARRAFGRLSSATDLRTRYVLLGPASLLAKTDAGAQSFLVTALSDKSALLRSGAVSAVRDPAAHAAELGRALTDENVRVREGAAVRLGEGHVASAGSALASVLERDRWPLVRIAAARALAALPPGEPLDEALLSSLEDESPAVRAAAIQALGQRGAKGATSPVRELLDDVSQPDAVRVAAARALGVLCDQASLGTLTKYAQKLVTGNVDASGFAVGESSIRALSDLGPRDLPKRLAPFFVKGVRTALRDAADRALHAKPRCPR